MNDIEARTRLTTLDTEISDQTERITTLQETMVRQLEQAVKFLQEEFQKKFDIARAQLIESANVQLQREAAAILADISAMEIEKSQLEAGLAGEIVQILDLENPETVEETVEMAAE